MNRKWLKSTYVEDLEAGDIEYTDEVLLFALGVQGLVDTIDEPLKTATVDRLAQRADRVHHLSLILALVHVLVTDLGYWTCQFSLKRNI